MGRSRYKTIEGKNTYFATSSTINWLPLFAIPALAQIVLEALRFIHMNQRIIIYGYTLMENHFHLIGTSSDFSNVMGKLRSFTARSVIDYLCTSGPEFYLEQLKFFKRAHKSDQEYQVWQEGYHPQVITDESMFIQKLEYIHHNPVRRGYVDLPEYWRYSSARQYLGEEGLVPVQFLL